MAAKNSTSCLHRPLVVGLCRLLLGFWAAALAAYPSVGRADPTPETLDSAASPQIELVGWESIARERFIVWYPGSGAEQPLTGKAPAHVSQALELTLVSVGDLLPNPWYLEFDVLIPATAADFEALTGFTAVETSAAARSRPPQLIINWTVFRNQSDYEQRQTLAHELLHLYVGTFCPVRPPLWMEEGLARVFAGEGGIGFAGLHGEFLFRSVAGSLHDLEDMVERFPARGNGRDLAYRQSAAVVGYFIRREFPGEGIKGMLAWMIDPDFGPTRMAAMRGASQARTLDQAWRHQLHSPVAIMSLFLQPTVMFGWSALLAVIAWFLIKRRRRRRLAMMAPFGEEATGATGPSSSSDYLEFEMGDEPSESR